jgi:hypothetical protein
MAPVRRMPIPLTHMAIVSAAAPIGTSPGLAVALDPIALAFLGLVVVTACVKPEDLEHLGAHDRCRVIADGHDDPRTRRTAEDDRQQERPSKQNCDPRAYPGQEGSQGGVS